MVFRKLRIPCPDGTELIANALLDTGADVAAISPAFEIKLQRQGIQLPLDRQLEVQVLNGDKQRFLFGGPLSAEVAARDLNIPRRLRFQFEPIVATSPYDVILDRDTLRSTG